MLGWFRGKKQHVAPPFGDRFTSPPEPMQGLYTGTLLARKERTWAGCVVMPDEVDRMPTVLLLRLGELCAPLKWLELEREPALVAAARGWRGQGHPPYEIREDALLGAADAERLGAAVGGEVTLRGVAYPMYMTGGFAPARIWGLYVRPAP